MAYVLDMKNSFKKLCDQFQRLYPLSMFYFFLLNIMVSKNIFSHQPDFVTHCAGDEDKRCWDEIIIKSVFANTVY